MEGQKELVFKIQRNIKKTINYSTIKRSREIILNEFPNCACYTIWILGQVVLCFKPEFQTKNIAIPYPTFTYSSPSQQTPTHCPIHANPVTVSHCQMLLTCVNIVVQTIVASRLLLRLSIFATYTQLVIPMLLSSTIVYCRL